MGPIPLQTRLFVQPLLLAVREMSTSQSAMMLCGRMADSFYPCVWQVALTCTIPSALEMSFIIKHYRNLRLYLNC